MASLTIIEKHRVRSEFDARNGIWYYSIVDVVAQATKSTDPRNYWKVLKNRLGKAQNKLVTQCNQLKMRAGDGKFYLTDVADAETILSILKDVSPEYVIPFRQYFEENELRGARGGTQKEASTGYASDPSKSSYPHLSVQTEEQNEEAQLLVDGYTENNIIIIQAFVAGIEAQNTFISVTHNTVTIKGERQLEHKNANIVEEELYWGKFSRTIALPHDIEIDEAEVTGHHGLITMRLPLINKNRTRIIKVKSI